MRLVPARAGWLPETLTQIPHLEKVLDLTRNPLDTFMRALLTIGDGPAVLIEDDVILTSGFMGKIEAAIAARPNVVQQFFSLRTRDAELGSRWMPGSSFCMGQCWHLPAGYAPAIYDYYPSWAGRAQHGLNSATDLIVAGFLASRRERYWLHVPSLVQHRRTRSVADPRRSSARQSPSFVP
jgi:hypothetical protein